MKRKDGDLSFEEELQNDVDQTMQMISRVDKQDVSSQEKSAIEMFQRVLTVVDKGGMCISDGNNVVSASHNSMPSSSYLAHGSRVLVQIPPVKDGEDTHEFMNWLTTGNRDIRFTEGIGGKDSHLFQRSVSSHSTHLDSIDGEWCSVEDKGVMVGAIDTLMSLTKPKDMSNHFGVNLAFGVDKLGCDKGGRVVNGPDGEHGHMYLHYRAPSKMYPGSLMIGVENSQPGKSNHSLLGTPNKSTHLGGAKWSGLQKKHDPLLGDSLIIPATLNGMRVDLSPEKQEELVAGKVGFDRDCVSRSPTVAADTRRQRLVNKRLYKIEHQCITLAEMLVERSCDEPINLPCAIKRDPNTRSRY